MRYFLTIVAVAVVIVIHNTKVFASISYADMFLPERGYKPVKDMWQDYKKTLSDNRLYKEWCVNTFEKGEQIYDAYKEIAFDIDYCSEPPKTDYWQTPLETKQNKQGDCEDSVFLFFSKLAELDIDGDITWGWVVDKNSSITFAHVWYQLFDKYGRQYIVEGFSKEWNGIIPLEKIKEAEERVPTLMLRHGYVNNVVNELLVDFDNPHKFSEPLDDEQFHWNIYFNNNHVITDIFQKLRLMFWRYKEQMNKLSLSQ